MIIPVYTIEASSRCSTISIHVHPSGEIHVKVPTNYDPAEVRQYVIESAGWIERTQRILFAQKNPPAQYSVTIDDRVIPYTVTFKGTRKNTSIFMRHNGSIEVRAPWDATVDSVTAVVERNKDWIRQNLMGNGKTKTKGPTPSKEGYEDSLVYNGMTLGYSVHFSSRARRITIKIKPDRSVEVVAPVRVSRNEIHRVITNKADWICAQVTSTKRAVAVRREFCDGEIYPFLGGTLTVRVTRGGSRATAVRNGAVLDVNLPSGMLPSLEQETIQHAVAVTVKDETLRAAIPRVFHFVAAFGVKAPQVNVRKNKGKWGFCTSRGDVTFASELCLLPPRLFDYVIAHEVCHLIVMAHSERFWAALCNVMPDCHDRRAELKRDSPLYRIFTD